MHAKDLDTAAFITDVSEELGKPENWHLVIDALDTDKHASALSELLRKASNGDRSIEADFGVIALEARDELASRIVSAHLQHRPVSPWASPALLVKHPNGRVPEPDVLHESQGRLAA